MSNPNSESEPVSRDDILWCYRTLLGREPESESSVAWHSQQTSFKALIEQIAKSNEFQAIVGAGGAWTRNQPMPPSACHDLLTFSRSINSDIRTLRNLYQVVSFEVRPLESSPLYLRDDQGAAINIHLPNDDVIGLSTVLHKQWEIGKPKFVEQIAADLHDDILLIDVGANVGLFSRQCLSLIPKIATLYAYEPHTTNFALLCRNLSGIQRACLNSFALGHATSTGHLYLDPDNAGNYSFNVNAMPKSFGSTSVQVVRAGDEERKWLAHGKKIFYKSDTQGADESIATSLSREFWKNVCGGIFELWRIPGKEYDADKFREILDSFPNKVFDKRPQQRISSSEIIKYLGSSDHQFDDLLFWRD